MFLHDNNLPLQLSPEHYFEPTIEELEKQTLFKHAYHPFALLSDLKEDGSFVTGDLQGTPILVRNFAGELHAFVNVCAHRFCKLTDHKQGVSPTLRCQYHGWEYDRTGATRKIPEAQGFRPLEKGQLALHKLRVETCGNLVFLAFRSDGPSLRQWLGTHFDVMESCQKNFRCRLVNKEKELAINWKVGIENTLESYHLMDVHKATLSAVYPEESDCIHELDERSSSFRVKDKDSMIAMKERWVNRAIRRFGQEPKNEYTHVHLFPHLTYATTDMFLSLQWFEPLGPSRCRMRWWVMFHDAGLLPFLWRYYFRMVQSRDIEFWDRVNQEDLAVLQSIQEGVQSRLLPKGGLLGTREERIWHFHSYYLKELSTNARG